MREGGSVKESWSNEEAAWNIKGQLQALDEDMKRK
jgi:hypothetical protein